MKANELRIGNCIKMLDFQKDDLAKSDICIVTSFSEKVVHWKSPSLLGITHSGTFNEDLQPIPLTEDILLKCGFSIITENSAGKRYAYVVNGIYSSDLSFTYWTTTKEKGKFFRGDLQLKSLHQLQNLYFALTGEELTINLQL